MGPIIIFDKSSLQGLNPDEAAFLDHFYSTNLTPLFFIETLADLEKRMKSGKKPEQVVGSIAYKTPDTNVYPNDHHMRLIINELIEGEKIEMRGVPIISHGMPTILEGKTGVVFQQSSEEEAFHRWQRREFLDLERLIAKSWRIALSSLDYEKIYENYRRLLPGKGIPKTLPAVKALADSIIDGPDQEYSIKLGLVTTGLSPKSHREILDKWNSKGKPNIHAFAPYFRHVFSVDLFFYLALASNLISRERPSNKVDIAYLYYFPFCMVFTSRDKLHVALAPLFLKDNQTFVNGLDLKMDLSNLDTHYSSLPKEIKDQGLYRFANYPPTEGSFLVTELWDKYLPNWRINKEKSILPLDKEREISIANEIDRIYKDSIPLDPNTPIKSNELHHIIFTRRISARKGKWKRLPPEAEEEARRKNRE